MALRRAPAILRWALSLVCGAMKTVSQVLAGIDLPREAMVGMRLRINRFGGIIVRGDAAIVDEVVLRDAPPNSSARGVPARILPLRERRAGAGEAAAETDLSLLIEQANAS